MHIEKITRLRESRTQAVFRKVLVRGTALWTQEEATFATHLDAVRLFAKTFFA